MMGIRVNSIGTLQACPIEKELQYYALLRSIIPTRNN